MPFVDVMSPDAYGRFNRRLAQLTNLPTAVYWSELLLVCSRVTEKKTYDVDGYFKLDRDYMTRRTTLSVDEQLEADSILTNLGVLDPYPDDPNRMRVDLQKMCNILIDETFKPSKTLKKNLTASKAQKSEAKKQGILITMKNCISELDPDIKSKYESWIDSVYASKRFLTKVLIQNFETSINKYVSNNWSATFTINKEVKLKLLDIAIRTGYTDPDWVITKFIDSSSRNITKLDPVNSSVSSGLNKEVAF